MIVLSIRQQGEREVFEGFETMKSVLDNVSPFWPKVLELARIYIKDEAFGDEGAGTAHGKWAPLSKRYAAWKAKHFPGKKILQRTGALMRSLVGNENAQVIMEADSLTVRSLIPYGGFHQIPGFDPRPPRRPPISWTTDQIRGLTNVLSRQMRSEMQTRRGR